MLGSREGSRLATSRPSSYPGEKRESKARFIEVAEKKIQGLLESLRRVLKILLKCPAVRTFSRISTKSLVLII